MSKISYCTLGKFLLHTYQFLLHTLCRKKHYFRPQLVTTVTTTVADDGVGRRTARFFKNTNEPFLFLASIFIRILWAYNTHSLWLSESRCLVWCFCVEKQNIDYEFWPDMSKISYCTLCVKKHTILGPDRDLHMLKLFSPSGSPTILVVPYQTGWQYSDGDLPNGGGSNARRYEKITIFDQYPALSRKWCKIKP